MRSWFRVSGLGLKIGASGLQSRLVDLGPRLI